MSDTHITEIVIDGFEVVIKVAYDYEPGDPGHYSGPPENCYPAIEEEWHFDKMWVATEDEWIRCDAMLPFVDQDRFIDEIKESWRT